MPEENKYTKKCEHCQKVLQPARAFWDGEPTYVGFIPCPCNRRIMTDNGVVYPGTEEHEIIVKNGSYKISDLLNEI